MTSKPELTPDEMRALVDRINRDSHGGFYPDESEHDEIAGIVENLDIDEDE